MSLNAEHLHLHDHSGMIILMQASEALASDREGIMPGQHLGEPEPNQKGASTKDRKAQ